MSFEATHVANPSLNIVTPTTGTIKRRQGIQDCALKRYLLRLYKLRGLLQIAVRDKDISKEAEADCQPLPTTITPLDWYAITFLLV